jgi:uncharacterized protein (TIGR03067 family)
MRKEIDEPMTGDVERFMASMFAEELDAVGLVHHDRLVPIFDRRLPIMIHGRWRSIENDVGADMSKRASLLLLPWLLVASPFVCGGDAKERDNLQGRWRWVKPASAAGGILFKGDSITFLGAAGKRSVKGAYAIDPSKKPMTLDITVDNDGKKTITLAIYDVKDDTLSICHFLGKRAATERPKEFVADKETVLGVLKRDDK